MSQRRWVLVLLVLALAVPGLASSKGFRAGVVRVVITPDIRTHQVFMAGFGYNRVATSVHDPLYASCIALTSGGQKVVLCSVDLIGFFYNDVLKVRAKVAAQVPDVTQVIVASTHDHEGPDTLGLWGPSPSTSGVNERYLRWLEGRIASCAVQALRSMQPTRLFLARDNSPLLALLQSDSRPPYVKDPHLFVMRFDSISTGKPLATLIDWSDHPETLGGRNTEITADYPCWLRRYVERHVGGIALFFNGSVGGLLSTLGKQVALQDPNTGQIAKDGTWEKAELFGRLLGKVVVRTLKTARPYAVDSLRVRKKVIFVPVANDRFRAALGGHVLANRSLFSHGKPDTRTVLKDLPGLGKVEYATGADVRTEVDYVAFMNGKRRVAEIATVPGEIYPELVNGGITRYPGADYPRAPFEPTLRKHFKSRYQFVFGLANDELGYIIPKAEWDSHPPWLKKSKHPWYGEINSVGPDAAAAVLHALVSLMG